MTRYELEFYSHNVPAIRKALERIADALEKNNKEDKIYYKTRKDMFADNPCTKEEYDAVKQENEELDTQHDYLHQLVRNLSADAFKEFCNEHCLPINDAVAVFSYFAKMYIFFNGKMRK